MRIYSPALVGTMLAAAALAAMATPTTPPTWGAQAAQRAEGTADDSEVATLYKQMAAAYQGLKSYQHVAIYTRYDETPQGEQKQVTHFRLVLERPNRFLFHSDSANGDAVCSDGTTLINYRNTQDSNQQPLREYVKHAAPVTLKGINLVDEVMFEPQGTYLVALALQGDMLADKDMTSIIGQAKMGEKVLENGKTYQTAVISDPHATMTLFVDADTHRLTKVVQKSLGTDALVTEEFREILIDKPIDPEVFHYAPPAGAQEVAKFTEV